MDKDKYDLWVFSTKVWKEAALVTKFMEGEINGLRDANGDPLPDAVKEFFLNLLYQQIKPRKGRALPRDSIREQYKLLVEFSPLPSDLIKEEMAKKLNVSAATIDQIVNPRKSRTK